MSYQTTYGNGAIDDISRVPESPGSSLGGTTPNHGEVHNFELESIKVIKNTLGEPTNPGVGTALKRLADVETNKATLTGVPGGQVLVGGTVQADTLKLQSNASMSAPAIVLTDNAISFGPNSPTTSIVSSVNGNTYKGCNYYLNLLPSDGIRWCGNAVSTKINSTANETFNRYGSFEEFFAASDNSFNLSGVYGGYRTVTVDGSGTLSLLYSNYLTWTVKGSRASASNYGAFFRGELGSSGAQGSSWGLYSYLTSTGAGACPSLTALVGHTDISGSGQITSAWGTEGFVRLFGSSSPKLTNAMGIGLCISCAATGTITNAYGVSIGGPGDNWSNAGTITNVYALYIDGTTNVGTNKWAVYSASAANSYLSGALGVGTSGPSAKLHSLATTEQLRLGYDAANYASITVSSAGVPTISATGAALVLSGDIRHDKTITAAGTTGAQTINKTCGSVNFASGATSLVVTNSRVTANSVIIATVAANDATMKSVQAVASAGSFTLYANAAATAATRVNFLVLN